jgi:type I restriction enzyme S subunit
MSRIDELILRFSTTPVARVKLSEVVEIRTGVQLNRSGLSSGAEFPVYNGGTTPSGYHSEANESGPCVVVSQGGSAGHVTWATGPFWAGAHLFVLREGARLEKRFLYFLLKYEQLRLQSFVKGAGIPGLSLRDIKEFTIQVPSLEVQQEIVRILDQFTELESELKAELEARRKQYEYYRNQLLTFDEHQVRRVPMGDVVRIRNGRDFKHLGDGEVPVYGSGGIMTYVDEYLTNVPTVLIPRKGSLANLYYVEQPVWTVDTIFYTEIDLDEISPKYLFHFLKTQDLARMNQAGGVPSLTQSTLNKITVPIPALSEQIRIVEKLDKFDDLLNDRVFGLPAEIEERRKQYEHYRDMLLTFPEVAA